MEPVAVIGVCVGVVGLLFGGVTLIKSFVESEKRSHSAELQAAKEVAAGMSELSTRVAMLTRALDHFSTVVEKIDARVSDLEQENVVLRIELEKLKENK